jgi:molybdopterin-containing oxidoreductase family membrane subunit
VWDISLYAGSFGWFFFLFFLFIRLLPAISIFEVRDLVHKIETEQHASVQVGGAGHVREA